MEVSPEIYEEERPWGRFRRFIENKSCTVKLITINPGESLSLQSHEGRSEFWRIVRGSGSSVIDHNNSNVKEGDELFVPRGSKHRLVAGADGLEILEIALGNFDENDITRYEDKYGRV